LIENVIQGGQKWFWLLENLIFGMEFINESKFGTSICIHDGIKIPRTNRASFGDL